ncbi:substrate-binding domain-containing protein [Amycolatopsis sp. NPDC059021]|uniref:substrate-binding domain-containing protein n=1 Tax=Amycolatopsis sp. NPDC059021 TaxID=3346704 RepID=UPI00366C5044
MTARLGLLALCVLLVLTTSCTTGSSAATTLRVLASSELDDVRPLLDDLRKETGITLEMDYQGTVEADNALNPGGYRHQLAWLSSARYFELKLKASGYTGPKPASTNIMSSPLVIGLKPQAAERLRRHAGHPRLSWADVANGAAAGLVRFGMADPRQTGSGLSALVGVATAAAGTGRALRPEDVTCDRLRGFLTGQSLTANTSRRLADEFAGRQDDADGLINYESVLLSLNGGGKLREPMEIIYPEDGMMLSEYPLLLLDPAQRTAYDKVVGWLKSEPVQRKLMERTLRRPLDPAVPRDPRLGQSIGNALYFPDEQAVVDRLLANYDRGAVAGQVIFLLDYSRSMAGARIAKLREAFAGLAGADGSRSGKFARFYKGEKFSVIRFGGRILDERTFAIESESDLNSVRDFVAVDDFDGSTAVWSSLDHAYRKAASLLGENPGKRVSIVLMTDGENNAGEGIEEFLGHYRAQAPAARDVHTYSIRFGEANSGELDRVARDTGGRMVDAGASSLQEAFKEIRGCE